MSPLKIDLVVREVGVKIREKKLRASVEQLLGRLLSDSEIIQHHRDERVEQDHGRIPMPRKLLASVCRHVSPLCCAVLVPSTFTKKTAIRITQMKISIEIAEPSPRFTRLISTL